MTITINGIIQEEAVKKTLLSYLLEKGFLPERVAVERNGSIVPKASYETTVLQDGDILEVVSFVGGG